jgi:hypothetical protein
VFTVRLSLDTGNEHPVKAAQWFKRSDFPSPKGEKLGLAYWVFSWYAVLSKLFENWTVWCAIELERKYRLCYDTQG